MIETIVDIGTDTRCNNAEQNLLESASRPMAAAVTISHLRRLKQYYRSAGWPVRDSIELDLLVTGCIELRCAPSGHESIYVTAIGIAALAEQLERNRRKLDAHESLVQRVATHLAAQGRLTFTQSHFKVKPGETWKTVRPDVFSITRCLDERYIVPKVHEIKVSRADLKGDLRNAEKRAGYQLVCSQLYYVFPEHVAKLEEIPPECGVVVIDAEDRWVERRPAPQQPNPLRPMHWLQLVAGLAGRPVDEVCQQCL